VKEAFNSCCSSTYYTNQVLLSSGFYSLRYFLKLLFLVAFLQTVQFAWKMNPTITSFDHKQWLYALSNFYPDGLEVSLHSAKGDSLPSITINKELPYYIPWNLHFDESGTAVVQRESQFNIIAFDKASQVNNNLPELCRKYNAAVVIFEDTILQCPQKQDEMFAAGQHRYRVPSTVHMQYLPELVIDQIAINEVLEYISQFTILKVLFDYKLGVVLVDVSVLIFSLFSLFFQWFFYSSVLQHSCLVCAVTILSVIQVLFWILPSDADKSTHHHTLHIDLPVLG